MIDTAQVSKTDFVTGKFVGSPARIDGIWLHAPTRVHPGYEVVELGSSHALVYHFRRWDFSEKVCLFSNPTLLNQYN